MNIKEVLKGLWAIPDTMRESLENVEAELSRAFDEQPAEESQELAITGDMVPLIERAVHPDGAVTVKIITPGWGSSGYYSPEVLSRDGPKVFKAGTKMFWDHATAEQESQRPEGRLDDLAGETLTDARWNADGPAGPGLYADSKLFGRYKEATDELAPHIGVSIRAMGRAESGEAEGKKGPIISAITAAKSIDFVTTPGAGGKILELFEAARAQPVQEVQTVTEQEAQELRDAMAALAEENSKLKDDAARMTEALLLKEVATLVAETLAGIEMPELTRARLQESLAGKPVIVDGALDRDATVAAATQAAEAEIAYIASVAEPTGQIRGLGSTPPPNPTGTLKESYREHWIKAGKAPDVAERLAEIAAQGR